MDGVCKSDVETRNVYKVLMGTPVWTQPHAVLRIRLVDITVISRKYIVSMFVR
jgi:hypothetical protein